MVWDCHVYVVLILFADPVMSFYYQANRTSFGNFLRFLTEVDTTPNKGNDPIIGQSKAKIDKFLLAVNWARGLNSLGSVTADGFRNTIASLTHKFVPNMPVYQIVYFHPTNRFFLNYDTHYFSTHQWLDQHNTHKHRTLETVKRQNGPR